MTIMFTMMQPEEDREYTISRNFHLRSTQDFLHFQSLVIPVKTIDNKDWRVRETICQPFLFWNFIGPVSACMVVAKERLVALTT